MNLIRSIILVTLLSLSLPGTGLSQAGTVTLYQANLQHGQGTDALFNFQRQVDYIADGDIAAVQERSTNETGWNTPLVNQGFVEAVYFENGHGNDGPAIWYKPATVTVNATYTKALFTGTNPNCGVPNVGWDCSTDVRKSAVAAKVTIATKQFYVVSVHLCWSRCADASGSTSSVQRVNQAQDLNNWINATFVDLPVVLLGDLNFAPDYPKSPSGLQHDIFTSNGFVDLWQAGITAGVATAPWGDRDSDGNADMPIGNLTTRTSDYRRIDYALLKTTGTPSLSLNSIQVPDLRATCPHALVAGGALPSCSPEVTGGPGQNQPNQWDIPEDFGVRPSDHNWIKVVLNLSSTGIVICQFNTSTRCIPS